MTLPDSDERAPDERVRSSLGAFRARTGLLAPGERVVAGCSGGADSTALLVVLVEAALRVHAVYIDHGLRAGTDAEARFVERVARAAGATFEAVAVRVER